MNFSVLSDSDSLCAVIRIDFADTLVQINLSFADKAKADRNRPDGTLAVTGRDTLSGSTGQVRPTTNALNLRELRENRCRAYKRCRGDSWRNSRWLDIVGQRRKGGGEEREKLSGSREYRNRSHARAIVIRLERSGRVDCKGIVAVTLLQAVSMNGLCRGYRCLAGSMHTENVYHSRNIFHGHEQ